MMMHNRGIHSVAWILVMVGGLNWLLQGAIGWDVGQLFGGMDATVSRIIYVLVGLSAVFEIATHGGRCRDCKPDGSMSNSQQQ